MHRIDLYSLKHAQRWLNTLGQEGGAVLPPPLAANEHHVPAALRRTVYRELEKERGLPAARRAREEDDAGVVERRCGGGRAGEEPLRH